MEEHGQPLVPERQTEEAPWESLISSTLLVILAKAFALAIRLTRAGAGSTWPGELALTLRKSFIRRLITKNPRLKVVVVIGTNGKTTTTKLITHILRRQGLRVFSNISGA